MTWKGGLLPRAWNLPCDLVLGSLIRLLQLDALTLSYLLIVSCEGSQLALQFIGAT